MKQNLSDIIADLILQVEDEEMALRLAEQDTALRETRCIDPRSGKWVDEHDIKYLFAALDLSDKDFAARFPEMQHITRRQREQLALSIKRHVGECPHCSLKQGYDLEWAARIKRICRDRRQTLLDLMQEGNKDERDAQEEGEHSGSPKTSSVAG